MRRERFLKRITILFVMVLFSMLAFAMTGCSSSVADSTETDVQDEEQSYIYYANVEGNDINGQHFDYGKYKSTKAIVQAVMNFMETTEELSDGGVTIPDYITFANMDIQGKMVQLNFNIVLQEEYDRGAEVLFKTAVAKTLLQFDDINSVSFIMHSPEYDEENDIVSMETMDEDSFVIYGKDDNGYTQTGQITIYFANEDGSALKEYKKKVEINNNVSLEEVVIESLITGPLRDGYVGTIPEGTQLIKISIKDSVAYVNFNDAFTGTANDLRSDLTIYSVVNSLIELPTVNKVQFMINGEKQELYRETINDFDGFFERNYEIIESEIGHEEKEEKEGTIE